MQKLALFLNGEKPKQIPNLEEYTEIYCTDGAYLFLEKMNIKPDLISGDFDSIKELPENIPHIHTPDQNFTDFEKALKIIIERNYTAVDVFAGSGLEQDHFMGNLSTALKYKSKIKITFFDDKQHYFFLNKYFKTNIEIGKKVSLFPFPKAKTVSSNGLKYPLDKLDLSIKKNKIGTRNEAKENEIEVCFEKGNLLIFIEN
ncbi:MAG: thiamine diphosphokinase [Chitinophagales bacterium]